jgi:hypothetical protein
MSYKKPIVTYTVNLHAIHPINQMIDKLPCKPYTWFVRTCYRHTWGFGGGTAPGDPERRERQLTRMRDNPLPLGQCPVIGAAPAALCSAR